MQVNQALRKVLQPISVDNSTEEHFASVGELRTLLDMERFFDDLAEQRQQELNNQDTNENSLTDE